MSEQSTIIPATEQELAAQVRETVKALNERLWHLGIDYGCESRVTVEQREVAGLPKVPFIVIKMVKEI